MIHLRLLGAASLAALATAAAAQDGSLTVLDYPGFEEPSFHPAYGEAHGEPTYSFFGDEEEAFQKLRSGFRADITHICAGGHLEGRRLGGSRPEPHRPAGRRQDGGGLFLAHRFRLHRHRL